MKMPATTIVAAWISADTGVGPAMASGSQVWRMNWPDFDMTAASSEHDATSRTRWLISPLTAISLIVDDVEGLAGAEEQDDHAADQADVAHAVGDEGLEGGVGVRLLLPPVADQRERAEARPAPSR